MDKIKLEVQFVPRYVSTTGYVKIVNDKGECINSEIKWFEFYYDENGNLIEEE